MQLSPTELRVLGALIEKEITTPENYPLSLNSLQAASNQRSSRDPILELSEEETRQALHSLQDLGLVSPNRDSRVPKFEHRARTVLNLRRDETAILCLLLLRGPQTPGELRSRADRLFTFEDLSAVTSTLDRLSSRPGPTGSEASAGPDSTGPLTVMLPRQPGAREARYAHLLGGPIPDSVLSSQIRQPIRDQNPPDAGSPSPLHAELEVLRAAVDALQHRVERLEASASESRPLE